MTKPRVCASKVTTWLAHQADISMSQTQHSLPNKMQMLTHVQTRVHTLCSSTRKLLSFKWTSWLLAHSLFPFINCVFSASVHTSLTFYNTLFKQPNIIWVTVKIIRLPLWDSETNVHIQNIKITCINMNEGGGGSDGGSGICCYCYCTSGTIQINNRHLLLQYNPEDSSEHHTHRRENLKSHK
jgi:hypothetical protein